MQATIDAELKRAADGQRMRGIPDHWGLVGLDENDAWLVVRRRGWRFRVLARGGTRVADELVGAYDPGQVNVAVTAGGVVAQVLGIG